MTTKLTLISSWILMVMAALLEPISFPATAWSLMFSIITLIIWFKVSSFRSYIIENKNTPFYRRRGFRIKLEVFILYIMTYWICLEFAYYLNGDRLPGRNFPLIMLITIYLPVGSELYADFFQRKTK